MESKLTSDNMAYKQLILIILLTLIASILPEIIFSEWFGSVPAGLRIAKLIVLFLAATLAHYLKHDKIAKYSLVLGVIISTEILTNIIMSSSFWKETFDVNSFIGNFGGSILLKALGIIPVIGVLIALFKTPSAVYIAKGDLSVKAEEIRWLGIRQDKISWGKLSIISAGCISLGTILLTIFTVTGTSADLSMDNLLKYFPYVIIFAVVNSFCEGIIFRSAIVGSLRYVLPKNQLLLIAAMLFGIGHYYGAPSGIVGVLMSGVLGWYMSRSMYETKGFLSSWIIHFMQDVVIFSTILLLGNYN